jgi:hypothetical protein
MAHTHEVDMTIKLVRGTWLVDVIQFTRDRHPTIPGKYHNIKHKHVASFRMKMAETDKNVIDLTVRAALAMVLRDMSGDTPPPAATAFSGVSPDTSEAQGCTINQAGRPQDTARPKGAPLSLVQDELDLGLPPKEAE